MSGTYHIGIKDDAGNALADSHGDLDVVSYVGKRAVGGLSANDTVTVKLIEVDGIGGDAKRTVLTITADGVTARDTLKRRISSERREASAPAETAEVGETVSV